MKTLIQDAKNFILDNLEVIDRTNKFIYLSNNNRHDKYKFNLAITMHKEIAKSRISNDLTIHTLKTKAKDIKEIIKFHRIEFKNLIQSISQIEESDLGKRLDLIEETISKKPKSVRKEFLTIPRVVSNRFICGYNSKFNFVMVFYKPNTTYVNDHYELLKTYERTFNDTLINITGGFYSINAGNTHQEDDNIISFFGSSSTYGNFKLYKDEIEKYCLDNNMFPKFI